MPTRQAADVGNQRFFGNGHGVNTIAEAVSPNRVAGLDLARLFIDVSWRTENQRINNKRKIRGDGQECPSYLARLALGTLP
jgi:hypothetical protein